MGDSSKSKRSRPETDAQLDGPKSKRSKREPASEAPDANGTPDDAKAKKSKKAKKIKNDKTADPAEDTGLSDQTRKVLSYVYQWKYAREEWKFSKANQKWLLKNFFSEDQVPDAYEDMCAAHLATCKGFSRRRLESFCQEKSVQAEGESEHTTAETRRARLLLPFLSEPEPT